MEAGGGASLDHYSVEIFANGDETIAHPGPRSGFRPGRPKVLISVCTDWTDTSRASVLGDKEMKWEEIYKGRLV